MPSISNYGCKSCLVNENGIRGVLRSVVVQFPAGELELDPEIRLLCVLACKHCPMEAAQVSRYVETDTSLGACLHIHQDFVFLSFTKCA